MDFSKYGLIEFNYIEAGRQIERLDIVYNETRQNIVNTIECIRALANLIEDYSCSISSYDLLNMGLDSYVNKIKINLNIEKKGYEEVVKETETSLEELNNVIDSVVQNNTKEYQDALRHAKLYYKQKGVFLSGKEINIGGRKVIYYNQYDYGSTPYGSSTIADSGCGPTAVAIVLSTLLNEEITPPQVGDYLADNGYLLKGGTNRAGFADVFNEYGVEYETMTETSENIINALKDGNMIVYSVGPSEFTQGSHFIVLTGLDDEGNVLVADPGSYDRTGGSWTSEDLYGWRYGDYMYVVKGSGN